MQRIGILAACAASIGAGLLWAGPVSPLADDAKVYSKFTLEPFHVRSTAGEFKAREQTAVIAIGEGTTPLGIYVYDIHGNCVARDDLSYSAISDDLALEFHPAERGYFDIEIRNQGRRSNSVEVAIR